MKKSLILFPFWLLAFSLQAQNFDDRNLIAYFPFNGNAEDASPYGNDGIVYGATLTNDKNGNPQSAYYFDGIDDYIDLGKINLERNFTICAWIKAEKNRDDFQMIMAKGQKGDGHFELFIEKHGRGEPYIPGQLRFYSQNLRGTRNTRYIGDFGIEKPIDNNQFHHIAVTFDSRRIKFFLDGNLEYQEFCEGRITPESDIFHIGRRAHRDQYHSPTYFHGVIDEVMIFSRNLSETEIKKLAQSDDFSKLSEVENRDVEIIDKIIDVKSADIEIQVWGGGKIGRDKITLFLNGEPILKDFELKKEKKRIPVKLKYNNSVVSLHALSLGDMKPSTAAMIIYDGDMEHLITLSSDFDKSGGVRIRIKEK
jgi:hypothetical protein